MKLLTILFILTTQFCFSQTKTLLELPRDSSKINLHLDEAKRLNTTSHLLFAAATISTMIIYQLDPKSPMLFVTPASLALTGMGTHIWSTHIENKYYQNN